MRSKLAIRRSSIKTVEILKSETIEMLNNKNEFCLTFLGK